MSAKTFLERFGYLFYIVNPKETSFATIEEVPDYVVQVVPHFAVLVLLEHFLLLYKKKPTLRINDAVGSVSQGMLQELTRVLVSSVQLIAYCYVYYNWRIVTLPWNSTWTWLLCFLGVDFAYYWLHRASHEINILWAAHQVHHSSEDYNLSTALRQSIFQNYSVWMFYLPLALAIPPSVFLIHTQFNLLYQFWIHTEVIRSLGPLEYILNTASHHRVHHGRNRYCIDKNYGGTLIIWDRIFGTFEPESEEVVYGLTHPLNTFEPLYIQLCHYMHIWSTIWETEGFWNKLSVIFKGPGWTPGNPWHGNIEDIPDVKAPVQKYDPYLPLWCKAYVFLHFVLLVVGYVEIVEKNYSLPRSVFYGAVIYELFSLTTAGRLLDGRSYAQWMEMVRCLTYFAVDYYLLPFTSLYENAFEYKWHFLTFVRFVYVASVVFWSQYFCRNITIKLHLTDKKFK